MQSNDMLAKLLANENIIVVRGNVHTASFDIKSRILTLPIWKGMENATEEMLILHEVGHALYTDMTYTEATENRSPVFRQLLNVIEDTRIERKMKLRYPGSRKAFSLGYKYLVDIDFFEINGKDLSSYNIVDRINLFYKIGPSAGIKFTRDELQLISMIDRCDSVKDVVSAAEAVYEFAKQKQEKQLEILSGTEVAQMMQEDRENEEAENEDDYDDYFNDDHDQPASSLDEYEEEVEEAKSNSQAASQEVPSGNFDEESLSSLTSKALEKNLERSADSSTIFKYYDPSFSVIYDQPILVGYKQLLVEMEEDVRTYFGESSSIAASTMMQSALSFKAENSPTISKMVKEFEMRKSATAWRRIQVSKTGSIDSRKLFAYKVRDDIFRQITSVKDGKKHGIVILLDWSGSMDDCMPNTIKQLISLVMFARRIEVPFQVLAFSSSYGSAVRTTELQTVATNPTGLGSNKMMTLLELFSDKMNERELQTMCSYLLGNIWNKASRFTLGGTPLNEALIAMVDRLAIFKRNNSVEKLIFVTLTDGEGCQLYNDVAENALVERSWNEKYKSIKHINYLRDSVTGKLYNITTDAYAQMSALLSLIKDRHDAFIVGYNLMENNSRSMYDFYRRNQHLRTGSITDSVYVTRSRLRSQRFVKLENNGYDKYFIVDNKALNVESTIDLGDIDSNTTARSAARMLGKVLNRNMTSRIILNQFAVDVA